MDDKLDLWNEKKKSINHSGTAKLYKERQVWWATLGINVGSEENGSSEEYQRPVLILKSFGPNVCLVVPLTTSSNKHPLRFPIGKVAAQEATALLSQIRVVDTKRLTKRICFIDNATFTEIRKTLRDLF